VKSIRCAAKFTPYKSMSPIDITNLHFLFFGYSAAWLIMIGFVFLLVQRGRRIDRELTRLKSLVDDKEHTESRR
jgi:CcmD family protein